MEKVRTMGSVREKVCKHIHLKRVKSLVNVCIQAMCLLTAIHIPSIASLMPLYLS